MSGAEVVAMAVIIAMSANHVPSMTATIGGIEVRASEVEIVTVWVTAIDAEVPVTSLPVKRAVEIGGCHKGVPLPIEQYVTQVEVTALPIGTEHIVTPRYTHQIVEIDFVCSFVLFVCQVQLIRHLVGEEQGLVAGLLIAHGVCRNAECQHGQQCEKHLLHNRIIFICLTFVELIHDAKKQQILQTCKGFSLIRRGFSLFVGFLTENDDEEGLF